MLKKYKLINNILGWFVFTIAAYVYIATSEPTASFWDCGEYIATAYKLQVGHPPGAPLFQMMGRFFTLFAFGDVTLVARMVNTMSALASAFTILFLFWTITALGKKVASVSGELNDAKVLAIFGSGLVGALAYTFSDSFWFSAVEGEVYATSSFFTAVVFWAILKWEVVADEPHANRWIVLIAFLVGLSIGVHLLNLLAIPAIVFVYYFKKYKDLSKLKLAIVFIISVLLLAVIMYVIIPWAVKLASLFELLFVNSFGMPFNSGTIIYFALLVGGIIWGLYYTQKKQKVLWNTIILCITFILIGYSSFFMLVIRSQANPPINENAPKNAISLLSYLNREQYGDWPLAYGQYFNAPVIDRADGNPVYTRDDASGKYIITDARKGVIPVYDPNFCTIFPRMWNDSEDHPKNYKTWGGIETPDDQPPTFGENLRFFFQYQIGHMYLRYFMWNFVGRQNDLQGYGGPLDGNWISGVKFIDEMRLGPQDIPESMKNNGRNKFYFLPLILGLVGFLFHLKYHGKDTIVVSLLFIFTGIAIVVYLNQYAYQPRERDYAYAASFYAFAIWIGLGVYAIFDALRKFAQPKIMALVSTVVCLLLVPGIMAQQGWDDHDRSMRYVARDFAANYLNSCAPNAILFTNGDNDTFPLWYAQEVEGIRTDIRVINLSLFNTDWYVDQMRRKVYDSEPVEFTMRPEQYRQGTRDYLRVYENPNIIDTKKPYDIKEIIKFVSSENKNAKLDFPEGRTNYFPTKFFRIPVDSATVVNNGTVPKELAGKIVPVDWKIKQNALAKNQIMLLDLLATNNWKRPIYFASSTGPEAYLGLENYFQCEGLAYRLVPIFTPKAEGQIGRINTDILYDNVMNKFKFGGIDKEGIYLEETTTRMTWSLKLVFQRLANALIAEGKKDKAVLVCDRCMEIMPEKTVPFNYFVLGIAEAYYKADQIEKANKIVNRLVELEEQNLKYYSRFSPNLAVKITSDKNQSLAVLYQINKVTSAYKQEDIAKKSQDLITFYYKPSDFEE